MSVLISPLIINPYSSVEKQLFFLVKGFLYDNVYVITYSLWCEIEQTSEKSVLRLCRVMESVKIRQNESLEKGSILFEFGKQYLKSSLLVHNFKKSN